MVLAEVLVRALRRVEGEERLLRGWGGGLHLLVRGVLEGVGDLGCFAEGAHAAAVPGADDEGADGGAEDVARGVLVRGLGRGGAVQLRSAEMGGQGVGE